MVLVEVIKLIIDINWCHDFLFYRESSSAWLNLFLIWSIVARIVVVVDNRFLSYLIAHHVQEDAESEENDTEDSESDHC